MSYRPAQKVLTYVLPGLDCNTANTDIGIFSGLPALYQVLFLRAIGATISPTLATVSLMTLAAGAGAALVNAFALAPLTAPGLSTDCTIAGGAPTARYNLRSLYVRNITAQGAALTVDFYLQILDLG